MTRRAAGKTIGDRKNSSRATRVFLYTSVGTIILYSIAASLPSIDRMLYDLTAFCLLETLGSGPNWGPGKLAILSVLLHLTMALNLAGFLLMFRRPGLGTRFLILLVLGVMYVTHTSLLYFPTYHVRLVEGVKIENMPSIEYEDIFSKVHIPLSEIETEGDFFTYARAQFETYRDFLKYKWGISDDQKLEAVFYMNLVSHLWGDGNKIHDEIPGCSTMNERTDFVRVKNPTIQTYLDSEIACCDDYAYLLGILLEQAGIKNRRVLVQGHIFNEIYTSGKWYTLDANTALMFEGSWESIQNRKGRYPNQVHLTIFPHHNLVARENPHYRERVGHFRLQWIWAAILKTAPPVTFYDHPVSRASPAPPSMGSRGAHGNSPDQDR